MTDGASRKLAAEYSSLMGIPPCAHCERMLECGDLGVIEMMGRKGDTSCGLFSIRDGALPVREMLDELKDKIVSIRKKWKRNRRIVRRRRAFAREIAQEIARALEKKGGAL